MSVASYVFRQSFAWPSCFFSVANPVDRDEQPRELELISPRRKLARIQLFPNLLFLSSIEAFLRAEVKSVAGGIARDRGLFPASFALL